MSEFVEDEVEFVPEDDIFGGGTDGAFSGNLSMIGDTEEFVAVAASGGKFVDASSITFNGAEFVAASCAWLRDELCIQIASVLRMKKHEVFEKILFMEMRCRQKMGKLMYKCWSPGVIVQAFSERLNPIAFSWFYTSLIARLTRKCNH